MLLETGPFSNPLSFLRSLFQPNDVQSRHSLFFDENTGGPLGGFGTNATLKQTDIGSAYNQTFRLAHFHTMMTCWLSTAG